MRRFEATARDPGDTSRQAVSRPPRRRTRGSRPPRRPTAPAAAKRTEVVVYPILAWLPIYGAHAILPNRPELPGLPPGEGGGSSIRHGWLAQRRRARGRVGGLAEVGVPVRTALGGPLGEAQRPHAKATADIIFGGVYGGRQIGHGVAVMGGVRRIAANLGVEIDTLPKFERKPGVWDPLVGVAWRRELGRKWIATVDVMGGGFGVGANVDASAARAPQLGPGQAHAHRLRLRHAPTWICRHGRWRQEGLTTQQTLLRPGSRHEPDTHSSRPARSHSAVTPCRE